MSTPANPTNASASTTAPAITLPTPSTSTLDKILGDFQVAAAVLSGVAPMIGPAGMAIAAGAGLADKFLTSILAGIQAHEAITGQPLDLTKLHEIPLVP